MIGKAASTTWARSLKVARPLAQVIENNMIRAASRESYYGLCVHGQVGSSIPILGGRSLCPVKNKGGAGKFC